MSSNVSMPTVAGAPRQLGADERAVLARIADTLIPANGDAPAASTEPGFWEALSTAMAARADAFEDIVAALDELNASANLWNALRSLEGEEPSTFQALSAVIAGAWLLTPGVRNRIGYHGQQAVKAGLEEAADEISSGILDPVLERGDTRWIR
jgi:hypothetical protein